MKRYTYAVLVAFVLVVAIGMRIIQIERPGLEWDETVYFRISSNLIEHGQPVLRMEGFSADSVYVYLFHPPLDFYLRGIWLGITGIHSISTLRVLSVIFSIATYIVVFGMIRQMVNKPTALIIILLIVTDGWLNYTNRLNLIENTQMFWITLGLFAYYNALKSNRPQSFVFAGILLGLAVVYKHTAIHIIGIPIIMALFSLKRKQWQKHMLVLIGIISICLIYFDVMALAYGKVFIQDTLVQIQRAFGGIDSRGLNFDAATTLKAIYETYWVFFTTVGILGVSAIVTLLNLARWRKGLLNQERKLLTAWYISAGGFLGVIALKAPHYLILLLLPAYCVTGVTLYYELHRYIRIENVRTVITVVLTAAVMLNFSTWYYRFFDHVPDNAMGEVIAFFNRELEGLDRPNILTEETLGVMLPDDAIYWNVNFQKDNESVMSEIDYIVLYNTITQEPPSSPLLDELLSHSQLVETFNGFKETIRVYYVNR